MYDDTFLASWSICMYDFIIEIIYKLIRNSDCILKIWKRYINEEWRRKPVNFSFKAAIIAVTDFAEEMIIYAELQDA